MKFKTYIKESIEPIVEEKPSYSETPSIVGDALDNFYAPVRKMISDGKFEEAAKELEDLERDLAEFEAENAKKKIFRFPKFIIDGQKKQLDALKAQLPKTESLKDMDKRCEKCNTLLTDAGSCPKCDEGEEDYGDELTEELSNKEKLKRAYPELNFDITETVTEEIQTEELSVREKLKRAYPELNFDTTVVEEVTVDSDSQEETTISQEAEDDWYDDDYDIEDDVEQDRRHAALYGGDRMYCKCGARLKMDEWGSYCPECNPDKEIYDDEI